MNDLLILCYHAVSADWPTEFAVAPEALERQLARLLRRGYRPLTLSQALAGDSAPKKLVVTFDDAYESVLAAGAPALASLGIPATVFVPTAYASAGEPMVWEEMAQWGSGSHAAELRCMSWEQLRGLRDAGWEIGSHSRSHRDLVDLGDAELEAELRGSREDCERELGDPCRHLAYPFSSYDARVKEAARLAGYESAAILDNHLAIPAGSLPKAGDGELDRFELLRSGVYRHDGTLRLAAKTSPLARRIRSSSRWRQALDRSPRDRKT